MPPQFPSGPAEPYRDSYSGTSSAPSAFVLVIIVLLVISLVVGLIGALFVFGEFSKAPPSLPGAGSGVQISGLRVASPDDACGLNHDDGGEVSLNPAVGPATITWGLPGPSGHVPCTVRTVATNTSGFELLATLPQTTTSIPGILIVSMILPEAFSGVLNVTFT